MSGMPTRMPASVASSVKPMSTMRRTVGCATADKIGEHGDGYACGERDQRAAGEVVEVEAASDDAGRAEGLDRLAVDDVALGDDGLAAVVAFGDGRDVAASVVALLRGLILVHIVLDDERGQHILEGEVLGVGGGGRGGGSELFVGSSARYLSMRSAVALERASERPRMPVSARSTRWTKVSNCPASIVSSARRPALLKPAAPGMAAICVIFDWRSPASVRRARIWIEQLVEFALLLGAHGGVERQGDGHDTARGGIARDRGGRVRFVLRVLRGDERARGHVALLRLLGEWQRGRPARR